MFIIKHHLLFISIHNFNLKIKKSYCKQEKKDGTPTIVRRYAKLLFSLGRIRGELDVVEATTLAVF